MLLLLVIVGAIIATVGAITASFDVRTIWGRHQVSEALFILMLTLAIVLGTTHPHLLLHLLLLLLFMLLIRIISNDLLMLLGVHPFPYK